MSAVLQPAGPDASDFDTAFPTTRPWLPEDLDTIRARADSHPPILRPLYLARCRWLQCDRAVHRATTYSDTDAISAAEWDRTAALGQVQAEQQHLANVVQGVARELGLYRPQLLAQLVLDALAEAARSDPVRLATILKPIIKASLEVLLEELYAELLRRLQDVERAVVSLAKGFAAKLGVLS